MNKKACISVLIICILSILFLSGCKDSGAEQSVGEKITSMTDSDTKEFLPLLEEGITLSNDLYVLPFPEELKEPYLTFLQSMFSHVSFEVSAAKKRERSHYFVKLTFSPIDIAASVKEQDAAYIKELETTDTISAMTALLKQDTDVVKNNLIYKEQTTLTMDVLKDGDAYVLSEKSIVELVKASLVNYMAPYHAVCDPLNSRDFLLAYLDAAFKGQTTQLAVHLNRSPQELEPIFNTTPADIPAAFSEDQKARYLAAIRSILGQCQYSVGIPQKNSDSYNYAADITYRPNTSITDAFASLQTGSYSSLDEALENGVQTLERYAASPVFGEETMQTIQFSPSALQSGAETDSVMEKLCFTICPIPQL